MNGKVKINVVYIKSETFTRIMSLFRIPSKKWGRRRVPEFWGDFIDRFIETIEFQILEKDAQIKALKTLFANHEFMLKMRTSENEKKTQEIECLKRQLADVMRDKDRMAS